MFRYHAAMCGRFTLHTPEARIRDAFGLQHSALSGLPPRYNIAPGQDICIIRTAGAGPVLDMARWGLVPHWSKEPKTRYSTINARVETVAEKPAYRTPFRRRRCLVPADGFYEWKIVNGKKTAHHIRMRDGAVFAFAGLWDRWEGAEQAFDSCTIIVMPANEVMRPLHERMPAIIAPAHYDAWLDPRVTGKAAIMPCLNPAPSSQLTYYPVSNRVNSPVHDDAQCIATAGTD